jgi:hypothetical protein
MRPHVIEQSNRVVHMASESLLAQLRSEGLRYRLWVTGTEHGNTVHMRVSDLCPAMGERIADVLGHSGFHLDVQRR